MRLSRVWGACPGSEGPQAQLPNSTGSTLPGHRPFTLPADGDSQLTSAVDTVLAGVPGPRGPPGPPGQCREQQQGWAEPGTHSGVLTSSGLSVGPVALAGYQGLGLPQPAVWPALWPLASEWPLAYVTGHRNPKFLTPTGSGSGLPSRGPGWGMHRSAWSPRPRVGWAQHRGGSGWAAGPGLQAEIRGRGQGWSMCDGLSLGLAWSPLSTDLTERTGSTG